jgi:hypothetical protein
VTASDGDYSDITDEELWEKAREFEVIIGDFVRGELLFTDKELFVCGLDILTAIIRVHRRLAHYNFFHDSKANECKEAALYAYWILKLKPIKIVDKAYSNKPGYNDIINERFAIHILISTLVAIKRVKLSDGRKGKRGIDLTVPNLFVEKLMHSFRYRNHTTGSLIILVESITTESFKLTEK